ncbi:type III secretion system chaperone family protein [Streptomyces malaysiensis]|uniref:hypothetical protein n=1 Tax=Streptomyces malaysiensis TaxID=92644 RepID=UPI003D9EBFF2
MRCTLCGRKMQPTTIHNHVYYRCGFNAQEQALYPDLTHPRTVYLREDIVCNALDQWIARTFASDRLTATIKALAHASTAASTAETRTPEQTQARQTIKNCERRLTRYQAALETGAAPTVVTQWINDAQRDKETAHNKLKALPATTRKKEPPLSAQQIRDVTKSLGETAQRIHTASTEQKGPLYDALGITISYEHTTKTATVRSRPSSPYRQRLCPRADTCSPRAPGSPCGPWRRLSRGAVPRGSPGRTGAVTARHCVRSAGRSVRSAPDLLPRPGLHGPALANRSNQVVALAERFLCGGHAAHLTPDSAARILRQAHIDPARALPVTHGGHGGRAMTLSSMFTLPMLTELHNRLRDKARQKEGRSPDPTAAIVDSQSVRRPRTSRARRPGTAVIPAAWSAGQPRSSISSSRSSNASTTAPGSWHCHAGGWWREP